MENSYKNKKIRFGVLGPGVIAHKFADGCKKTNNAEVYGVASRNKERAQKFAKEYDIKNVYGSYDEMLADKNIDAVYISVINSKHIDLIKKSSEYGKAILCEKPYVVNCEQAAITSKLIKEKNILFMEGMWTNFLPTIQKAKEWVKDGRIGKVKEIDSAFSFKTSPKESKRLFDKDLYGGAVLDVGIYCIAFAINMLDKFPTKVNAISRIGETGVDEYGIAALGFDETIATCRYGITMHLPEDAYIYGDQGYIKLKNFWRCNEISLYNNEDEQIELFTGEFSNGFEYEIEHFANLLLDGKKESDINSIMMSEKCIEIIEDIKKLNI